MDNRELLLKYIKSLKRKKILTKFIAYIFNYDNFNDYNYIFRIFKKNNQIIMDIYDNISINRFNRYIFEYNNNTKSNIIIKDNVYVTYINIKNLENSDNKLYKLAYIFKLNKKEMLEYAKTFLKEEYIEVLKTIIK